MRTSHLLLAATGMLAGTAAIILPNRFQEPERVASSELEERSGPAVRSQPAAPDRPNPKRPRVTGEPPRPSTRWVEELAARRTAVPEPFTFDRRNLPQGVLLQDGSRATVTFTPWPVDEARAASTVEVVVGERVHRDGRFFAPLTNLDLAPGSYEVRVNGHPCVGHFRMPGTRWLYVQEPAATRPVLVAEYTSGCFMSGASVREYERSSGGYVAADGERLPMAAVEDLRARVLASRPRRGESSAQILEEPDAYLASLGLTDDVIGEHVPEIKRLCVGDWRDHDGRPLEIPSELDGLFELSAIKRMLVEHLLYAPERSTTSHSTLIEIPGEPWIYLSNESNGPDLVPWYVAAGDERWYALDRELSHALVDLAFENGSMRRRLERTSNWRETLWSDTAVWNTLAKRTREALALVSYRMVAGWETVEERFAPEPLRGLRPSGPRLPAMNLLVREPETIDWVLVRGAGERDWNDVLADYERAEAMLSEQTWLAQWKRENGGRIGVWLPLGIENLHDRSSIRELWEDEAIGGAPELAISFGRPARHGASRSFTNLGGGVLSADGTLVVFRSSGPRGPLGGVDRRKVSLRTDGRYGLVVPGGELELIE
ncbi:MAG: hypothetical protein GY711_19030 [bacterium]|nr:hypothetical protein [bacterium]